MKKILVPTDFSSNAWNAVCYALDFFKDEECTFYFLHTYIPHFYRTDYTMGGVAMYSTPDALRQISLAGLEKTLTNVKERYSNSKHSYECLSAFNLLTDEINEVVAREKIDLVVMGTQGATGSKEIFLGTNAVFTIRKAKVPVLVIPEKSMFHELEKILFPTDYMTFYKRRELKPMIRMAKARNAKITVLHVVGERELTEKQKSNREFLDECLEETDHHFKEIHKQLMPDAIHNYIRDNDFNMLAMMKRKHSFLERLLLKQNVDSIGFHVKIPFLVMPDTAKISY
ncbi:universal stress protein [Leptobacterium flavescens]|uniref:Universal stress protein n=1 Tax=Leptobacterium flavescens TaxID=472055 RepID=A0A6P0ULP6_9FLAO|nr:universal stress protein [Leptobacterium flavescens]NER13452.1 universal stress protein [Leptobacterium flavescens]